MKIAILDWFLQNGYLHDEVLRIIDLTDVLID